MSDSDDPHWAALVRDYVVSIWYFKVTAPDKVLFSSEKYLYFYFSMKTFVVGTH